MPVIWLIKAIWLVYAVVWIGGVVNGGASKVAPWAAPAFLVIAGALTVLENRAAWKSLAAAALAGFLVEIVGVHTGLPFGHYRYTHVLAPSIAGVPIAIAFAWLILIDFVRGLCRSAVAGAVLMAAIDLVIDPLAAGPLHYWQWLDGGQYYGVPLLNFAGWMITSVPILLLVPHREIRHSKAGWSVVAFFAILAFERRLYFPAIAGAALTLLPLLSRHFSSGRQAASDRPSEIPF